MYRVGSYIEINGYGQCVIENAHLLAGQWLIIARTAWGVRVWATRNVGH